MSDPLGASMAYATTVTRQAKSSFPLAFRLLPKEQRQAMDALYAYMRLTDDLADGDHPDKPAALTAWRESLHAALEGTPTHPVHLALTHIVNRFGIQPRYLFDVIDGMEMDLSPRCFARFEELAEYCYKVAGVVGLSCIPIWGLKPGVTWAEVEPPAIAAGVAFQLTNILRDLAEDTARGRVYLPQEELRTAGITPPDWLRDPARFRTLMVLQCDRAEEHYRQAAKLTPLLSREGQAIYSAMTQLYHRLLIAIIRQDHNPLTRRVKLTKTTKLRILAQAWWHKTTQ
jgi:15-cis-phytoene synthase